MDRRCILLLSTRFLLCILLLSAVLLGAQSRVSAQTPKVTVYLEPSKYIFGPGNASLGKLFNVTVWVKGDTPFNLMMWQVYLTFNNSLIMPVFYNSTSWKEIIPLVWPNNDKGGRNFNESYVFYGESGMMAKPSYENLGGGLGAVSHGDTLLNEVNVSAPKILCIVTFNITKVPDGVLSCTLGINNDGTYLFDWNGPIPYTVVKEDGTYLFIPEFSTSILIVFLSTSLVAAIAKYKLKRYPKNIH